MRAPAVPTEPIIEMAAAAAAVAVVVAVVMRRYRLIKELSGEPQRALGPQKSADLPRLR